MIRCKRQLNKKLFGETKKVLDNILHIEHKLDSHAHKKNDEKEGGSGGVSDLDEFKYKHILYLFR